MTGGLMVPPTWGRFVAHQMISILIFGFLDDHVPTHITEGQGTLQCTSLVEEQTKNRNHVFTFSGISNNVFAKKLDWYFGDKQCWHVHVSCERIGLVISLQQKCQFIHFSIEQSTSSIQQCCLIECSHINISTYQLHHPSKAFKAVMVQCAHTSDCAHVAPRAALRQILDKVMFIRFTRKFCVLGISLLVVFYEFMMQW